MNTAIVRPFMVATKRVFEKMLECPCRVGKPTVSRGFNSNEDTVHAVIEVSGTHRGYMVLALPSTIASVAASLLGAPEDFDPVKQNVWASDQIARMVKTLARRSSHSPGLTLAALSHSDPDFQESTLRKVGAWLAVPMAGRFGKFSFALCIKPVQSIPTAPDEVALAG